MQRIGEKQVVVNAYIRIQSDWVSAFLGNEAGKKFFFLFKKDRYAKHTHLLRSCDWLGPWVVSRQILSA